ncbi:uncharacterized protein LOC121725541 [Aricia agestis]|uniref:uncharacterized protein LOC121725541 n=1 Tax=Aricia agestis TaxID=91739 RepID=UPI001C2022A5|nr:uncharacterized protein LOC121725541 [Aricia agestis]
MDSDDEKPLKKFATSSLATFEGDSETTSFHEPEKKSESHEDLLAIFEMFFTDQVLQQIVKCTNYYIEKSNKKYKNSSGLTNINEIRALLGVLILTAAMNENHFTPEDIFTSEIRGPQYMSCMSHQRFSFLLQNLRFDDSDADAEETESDPFTPMSNIWISLITQCRSNYVCGRNVTIDEIFVPFRGNCSFKMFLPDNEKKYGIKIMTMCDSSSYYMIDAMPYLGKYTKTDGCSLSEFYVRQLTKTIHGTNANVTIKTLKPSIYLAEQMLKDPYKLTMIGPLKASSKDLPRVLTRNTNHEIGTPIFSSVGAVTLMSYNISSTKKLFLLSSGDEKDSIDTSTDVPCMLEKYNSTKNSVMAFDQMCSDMTCKRKTNNWTISLFYNLINMVTVNCYILYCQNSRNMNRKPMQRRVFMNKLHSDLANPWRKVRFGFSNMPRSVRDDIEAVLNKQNISCPSIQSVAKAKSVIPEGSAKSTRRICSMCHYKKRRNTKKVCKKCNAHICGEHTIHFCITCAHQIFPM